jgi:hypothetical protein
MTTMGWNNEGIWQRQVRSTSLPGSETKEDNAMDFMSSMGSLWMVGMQHPCFGSSALSPRGKPMTQGQDWRRERLSLK